MRAEAMNLRSKCKDESIASEAIAGPAVSGQHLSALIPGSA